MYHHLTDIYDDKLHHIMTCYYDGEGRQRKPFRRDDNTPTARGENGA